MATMLPYFQVDAFTSEVFGGNPAGVCPLEEWLDDDLMQTIAAENNLSETAFFVGKNGRYDLRWFTPKSEVDLCGHATLAAAHILLNELEPRRAAVDFDTKSGVLTVRQKEDALHMELPSLRATRVESLPAVEQAIGMKPLEIYEGAKVVAVLENEQTVRGVQPDFAAIASLGRGLSITARGDEVDFVSRHFAPHVGINEDPVTGSAHCILTPFWAERLGKKLLAARQVSARGGQLTCEDRGKTVSISGEAVVYLRGAIIV